MNPDPDPGHFYIFILKLDESFRSSVFGFRSKKGVFFEVFV